MRHEDRKIEIPAAQDPPAIVAVVVLFRQRAEESTALNSLQTCRAALPEMAAAIEVMVWDNTPGMRERPGGFSGIFIHDDTNPGLAAAYDAALQHAAAIGAPWLMLLDQDTEVTARYLHEVIATLPLTKAVAVVPRLRHGPRAVSPFRPQVQGPVQPLEDRVTGISPVPLQAFNSGAVVAVAAMERQGGFDRAFPLDYLDHATFAALQARGGKVHVLASRLTHELATDTGQAMTTAGLQRQRDILAAERRYIRIYGTTQQRRMWPVRVLRQILSVLLHKRDIRHAWLILYCALEKPR
jgi:GT2 family glycosyltransferase